MVAQIKTKKRGRGRPKSEDKLLIDSERAHFKVRNRIIDISADAIEVIYSIMKNQEAPPQTRLGSAKMVLEMSAEIHKELVESESAQYEDEVSPDNKVESDQSDVDNNLIDVIDWGDFKQNIK